ncbi:molybdenum ABC transporter ATP-binding protein [Agrobacterium vitis]|uniref:Molybdenum ABC transporter ATP-binding protein n=2 Tax=Agrobacterium vitis TaxID=373 RepID=A0AAE4WFL6_AGRVI|nr:molybdenum ABC transporter ATP-binding protein [Agrobacterium vitis]MCF1499714.1 molybdenum ABC transporter ATP-binding protein [Allorhizobium sp. Av2]MCM2440782.1 molybdenum ABC transporter ATP-binding protein [Agrobacterium vitis]MUZ59239.1 molybdenum ABC transporter ATP-binding protein [Agrobacterium vitis]MVA66888.1 molybdenum ABC transporter ATP-binding protein [Agrobacterium vitis]MVA87331.1 molybdenum ABC transporter ATP-binding protein [Agrobacterium vitis]
MMLEIDIRHRQGTFDLEADLQLGSGLTALFGPSGSGKTTMINAVAGLIRPDQGRVAFEGRVWSDAQSGIFLPPHRRRIGYVFQEARLFPHLNVRANLTYGRYFTPKAERREDLSRICDLLGITDLLDRAPNGLSGGEKQRVAIARALMASPKLLLMDEPLSALDAALKAQILPYIERIRDEAGVPILYVSHAVEEVTRLASRVVTMSKGRAARVDLGEGALLHLPRLGDSRPGSFLHAHVNGHAREEGLTLATSPAGPLFLKYADLPVGTPIRLFIAASDLVLATGETGQLSTLNRLSGRVQAIFETGPGIVIRVDCSGQVIDAEITRRSLTALDLALGKPVSLLFKAVSVEAGGVYRLRTDPLG